MFINKNKSSLISKIRKYVYKNNNIYILNQQDKYLIISIYVSIFMVLLYALYDTIADGSIFISFVLSIVSIIFIIGCSSIFIGFLKEWIKFNDITMNMNDINKTIPKHLGELSYFEYIYYTVENDYNCEDTINEKEKII